jgi:hypothetical protein
VFIMAGVFDVDWQCLGSVEVGGIILSYCQISEQPNNFVLLKKGQLQYCGCHLEGSTEV